ncbi:MAG: hypothetical protein L6406_12525 [Desulfobacterales bacterium]|nr:hypothetical protein [Desulfobacterales bacterium]
MKCPKCGYISFDHNEVCPKCNKNIAALRDKMSLPSYKAAPLSMLKALTGEASDSGADISVQVSEDTASVLEEEEGLSLEDSQAIEAMEKTFKDSQEFDMQLETTLDEVWDETPKEDAADLSLDIEDLPIEDARFEPAQAEDEAEIETIVDSDLLPTEGGDPEKTALFEPVEADEETTGFNLDDLSRSESGPISEVKLQEKAEDDVPIDLEGLALALEEPTKNLNQFMKPEDEEVDNGSLELEDLDLDLDLEGLDRKPS